MTTAPGYVSAKKAILLVGKGVVIETIRRKDLYVLMMLCCIYVLGLGVVLIVGIENESTINFLLNLGITFAWFSAHLLTLLTIARQVPDEEESRTLHPMLAKPIARWHYLIGKWGAACCVGLITFASMFFLSMFPWIFASQRPPLDGLLFMQALALTPLSICMMGSLGLIGSLITPKPVNITMFVLFFLFSSKLQQFIRARFHDSPFSGVVDWLSAYIPDFTRLNLFDRYTDGMPAVDGSVWLGLLVYGSLFIAISLMASETIFRRRWL